MIHTLRVLLLLYLSWPSSLQEENLIQKIKSQVTTAMSSQWLTWSAEKAINYSDNRTNANVCNCCAGAYKLQSWWSLDLGNTYPIKTIIYIGRSDYAVQSRGFTIYKVVSGTIQLIHQNNATSGNQFIIDLNPPVALQQMKITHKLSISICQLKLTESETCPAGRFGQHCEKQCHCSNTLPCSRSYGVCSTDGCEPGWNGPACDLECDDGSFGQNCSSVCHCKNNAMCNHISGECPGGICAPGWKGNNCNTECNDGSFGQNCGLICHCQNNARCNHINGECPGGVCAPGWKGFDCNTECYDGSFGQNCSSLCHCQNNAVCGHTNGQCPGGICASGWKGFNCNSECSDGSFGKHCSSICHCQNNVRCNHISGECPGGICAPGLIGFDCNTECYHGSFGQNCNSVCHCKNNVMCNHMNGECPDGICAPGWKGFNCNTECDHGTFGQDCQSECHCLDQPCDHVNGRCSSGLCANGWKGVNCNTECNDGSFGQNCSWVCHCQTNVTCNHVNGRCPDGVCAPGWKGVNCNTECDHATFGQDCQSECHCMDHPCDRVNGSCPSGLCEEGWKGIYCNTACQNETFGQNCTSTCHCHEASVCHHIDGSCGDSGCTDGWDGNNCSIVAEALTEPDEGTPTGAVVGAVLAAIAVTVVVTAAIILYRKRISNRNNTSSSLHRPPSKDTFSADLSAEHIYKNTAVIYDEETNMDETEHIYQDIREPVGQIPIKQLWAFMKTAYEQRFEELFVEFEALQCTQLNTCSKLARVTNKNKNKDLQTYDHSKVTRTEDGKTIHTKLDANFLDGYDRRKRFIATQGATQQTVNEFWEMAYQENISVIVMLMDHSEHNTNRYVQYWPFEGKTKYGQVVVKTVKFTTFSDHVVRQFIVSKVNKPQRQITQIQFTGWTEGNLPTNAWHFVQFWRKSMSLPNKTGPVIVHCSNGIGRTGTYIALDILYTQALAEGFVHPQEVIKRLRNQRENMVQTKEQYAFLHEALAEALYVRAKPIKSTEFEDSFTSLSKEDTVSGITGLSIQYDTFFRNDTTYSELQHRHSEHEYSSLSSTREGITQRTVPSASKTCVKENPPQSIILQNYAQQDAFVLTTASVECFSDELWNMIESMKIKTVISFDSDIESRATGRQDDKEEHSMFAVHKLETERDKHVLVNSYVCKRKKSIEAEVKTVKEFVYTDWQGDEVVPGDMKAIISFICTVQRWQPAVNEKHPVLLSYRFDLKKISICCVLLNELERIRSTGEVNLLESVKRLTEKDGQFTPSFEQYQFCHAVILEYIKEYDVYVNI